MALSHSSPLEGAARFVFIRRGTTRLARLFQKAPLRVLMPRPAPGEPPCAVLLNTSGGIVGGDALRVEVRLEAGAAAVITSQAAEKAYRSAGADATLDVTLDLADGAWLEWLPQETILFDGARLRRRLRIDAAAQARLVATDMLVFGRRARGERFQSGFLYDRWEVRIGRRLAWVEALHLTPDPGALLDARFGFAGAGAAATAIYVAPDAVSGRCSSCAGWATIRRPCALPCSNSARASGTRSPACPIACRRSGGPEPVLIPDAALTRYCLPLENQRTAFAAAPREQQSVPDEGFELFPVLKDAPAGRRSVGGPAAARDRLRPGDAPAPAAAR
jgi:urease accessory protein UreH